MGAPLEICSKRGVVAVLASGVVISLTALTGGITPAFAQPDDDQVVTTIMPEPEQSAPELEEVAPEAPASAAPETQQAPPSAAQAPQNQAPRNQAPVVEPEPEIQAPETPPEPETQAPEPKTQEPATTSTAIAPPVTSVEPAEPAETEEAETTTVKPAPATTTAPTTAADTADTADTTAPATTASESAQKSATSDQPSAALVPDSETSEPPTSGTETPTGDATTTETSTEEASGDESETPTVSIAQTSKEIETVEPQTLEAPDEDIQLARNAKPVFEEEPAAAAETDIASFTNEIETSLKIPGLEIGASSKTEIGVGDADVELVSNVRQWRPEWIEYDEYYRPIFMNPYRDPVRIVYIYDMRPRITIIPPLARMVLEVAQYAAYSFTAAVLAPVVAAANVAQTLTNIAVGSFFGGGYFPGVGLPLPPPPPPVLRYDNVPVFVNYSNARYEPFRVRQIVDVGEDRVYGGRKALLDGVTPVWGEWTQTATGERQFEVRRTQQFPGLSEPAEAPLPGDYRLRLASDEASTGGLSGRDIFLMVAAGVIGTLGFGAIGLAFFLGRRRPDEVV